MKEQIELTEEQKEIILNRWNQDNENPPSLKELTSLCFGDDVDTRSVYGRAIRKFLSTRKLKAKVTSVYEKKGDLELTEEQREYIANNASTMNALEMAKVLFNNLNLTNLNQEVRTVANHLKTLPTNIFQDMEQIPDEEYKPPKTIEHAKVRVNKYTFKGITQQDLELTKIRKNLESLIRYCHLHRFVMTYNAYDSTRERDLFEGCYVRFIWDKPDLTEEEVDMYINLCCDIVQHNNMQNELALLTRAQQDAFRNNDRAAMSLVEAIESLRRAINDNEKRQKDLTKSLQGERSDREKRKLQENASVLQLVEAWRTEEKRKQLIDIANMRKQKVKEEIKRLDTIDALKAEIWGLDKEAFEI